MSRTWIDGGGGIGNGMGTDRGDGYQVRDRRSLRSKTEDRRLEEEQRQKIASL
jgi:hypothetical protein